MAGMRSATDGNPDASGYLGNLVGQTAGANQAAVAGTAATNSTPYGYSQAQADAIVTLLNAVRATLVASGLWKGSA